MYFSFPFFSFSLFLSSFRRFFFHVVVAAAGLFVPFAFEQATSLAPLFALVFSSLVKVISNLNPGLCVAVALFFHVLCVAPCEMKTSEVFNYEGLRSRKKRQNHGCFRSCGHFKWYIAIYRLNTQSSTTAMKRSQWVSIAQWFILDAAARLHSGV